MVDKVKLGKSLMELLGTAILVLTIQVSVTLGSAAAPCAIGAVLITIVFAGGPISGAHYNPAITLAIRLRGKVLTHELAVYWVSQVLGGILGAVLGGVIAGNFSNIGVGEGFSLSQAILAEIVFTFILCFVVLGVATSSKSDGNDYYGLAIGLVVLSGAYTVGPISGGAFNPGVALGLCIAKGFDNFSYVISVVIANLIGGALASGCFYLTAPDQFEGYTSVV